MVSAPATARKPRSVSGAQSNEADPHDPYAAAGQGFEPPLDVEKLLAEMVPGIIHSTERDVTSSLVSRGWETSEIVKFVVAGLERMIESNGLPDGWPENWRDSEERKIADMTESWEKKLLASPRDAAKLAKTRARLTQNHERQQATMTKQAVAGVKKSSRSATQQAAESMRDDEAPDEAEAAGSDHGAAFAIDRTKKREVPAAGTWRNNGNFRMGHVTTSKLVHLRVENGIEIAEPICAAFVVEGYVRDARGEEPGLLISWTDDDHVKHETIIAATDLHADAPELARRLEALHLLVEANRDARLRLQHYFALIRQLKNIPRVTTVKALGFQYHSRRARFRPARKHIWRMRGARVRRRPRSACISPERDPGVLEAANRRAARAAQARRAGHVYRLRRSHRRLAGAPRLWR